MKFALSSLIALVLAAAGCESSARAPDQDYRNFETAIASASKDGYTPYWLGREFAVGGLAFTGPATPDFGAEVEGGGADFSYHATLLPGRGSVGLQIILFSQAAWDKVKAVQGGVPATGATVTAVTVAGAAGRLLELHNSVGTLEQTRLILQLGETTVLAMASHTYSATPAPDVNPLTGKQTFISVMQNLRLYPQ